MTKEEAIEILKHPSEMYQGSDGVVGYTFNPNRENYEAFQLAIKTLEQETILDKDCEHCSKTYGTLGCCDTVSNKWVYSCKEGQREYLLDKIKSEIEQDAFTDVNGEKYTFVNRVNRIIDKYKSESR